MNDAVYPHRLLSWAASFQPDEHTVSRLLAAYSAAIALAHEPALSALVKLGRENSLSRDHFYEIVLQSYLFLGFPRMLTAAEHLADCFDNPEQTPQTEPITPDEAREWFDRGMALCQRIYDRSFDSLQKRVETIAPEIFRWMIVEGYGKVLSRPGVTPVDRELSIVACLIVENRPRQLDSHLRGAINVGAGLELLGTIVEDLRATAPSGYQSARSLMDRLGDER